MRPIAEQMAFYSAYHRHPMNRATHFVGVPIIVYSLMVVLAMPPLRLDVASLPFALTPALAIVVVLLAYYIVLDAAIGLAMVLVFSALLAAAEATVALGTTAAWVAFAIAFVGGWVFQLLGHGVWEKRRPALASNLFQVFIAPLFLMAEVFFALGMKRDVHDRVEEIVASGRHGTPSDAAGEAQGA